MQLVLPIDGHHPGPLFGPLSIRKAPRQRPSGGKEVWAKYRRATPPWADLAAIRAVWAESRRLTAATGVQHSVDHVVPLVHPLVCGLHWHGNLAARPLVENIAKGNRWWPDMPGEQEALW